MTVPEVYAAVLECFGVADPADATAAARARALIDINAAIQLLAGAGPDFYGRARSTVAMSDGIGEYTLPKAVQTVLEPVALQMDGLPLRKLTTRGQVRQFGNLFLGQLSVAFVQSDETGEVVAAVSVQVKE